MATVHYRPLPARFLPYGPVKAIVCPPKLCVTWYIDPDEMDPLLAFAYAAAGTTAVRNLAAITARQVLVQPDCTVPMDQLIDVDLYAPVCILVRVTAALITERAARELSTHSTDVLQALTGDAGGVPVIGESSYRL